MTLKKSVVRRNKVSFKKGEAAFLGSPKKKQMRKQIATAEDKPILGQVIPNVQRLDTEVIVVGAGLAGLTCASTLRAAGVGVTVFEASEHLGGRVRTVRENELVSSKCPMNHSKWLRVDLPPSVREEHALGRSNFGYGVLVPVFFFPPVSDCLRRVVSSV